MKKVTYTPDGELKIEWRLPGAQWKETKDNVKSLDGRTFSPKLKCWFAPATAENLEKLKLWGFDIPETTEPEPDNWTAPWLELELSRTVPDYLRPYQIEVMKFLKYRNGRGLIGEPMGAGKTVMGLSFLQMSKQFPALIVVPATIKIQWAREWYKFIQTADEVDILYGQTPVPLTPGKSYIINWDILLYWKDELAQLDFKTLIADESHRAGNPKAQRTKALKQLARKIPYFLPMSGTPIKTKPRQFFPILNMIDKEEWDNEYFFLQRYCDPVFDGFGWNFDGASNLKELHQRVRDYMIRHDKSEILKDLPEKSVSVLPLPITGSTEAYQAQLKKFLESSGLESQEEFNNLKIQAFVLKQKLVLEWIKDFIQSGEKILIGTYHRKVIKFLSDAFKDKSVCIYGGVSAKQRELALDEFKNNNNVQILFGQILSAGEGIDGLQNVCHNCAFVEFAHSPSDHDQFEARLHRSGQKNPTNVYYLVAEDTIEIDMAESLDEKRKTFDAVINGVETEQENFIIYLKNKYGAYETQEN